jgi:AcrR family transcriptional regulator
MSVCVNTVDERTIYSMRSYKSAEERRTEILETSLNLFSRQGFQGTTMEHIASSIKIARTTLYEYYKSKEDILYSLINDVVEEESKNALNGSIRTQLEILASESIKRLQNNYILYKILFQELPTLARPTSDKIRAWQGRSMVMVQQVIEKGISEGVFASSLKVEDIAFAFKALIGQRLADLLLTESQVHPENEAKRLIDLLWLGVGHESINLNVAGENHE